VSFRIVGVLMVCRTNDVIRPAHRTVDIAQQRIAEVLSVGECKVFGRGVERRAEYSAVCGSEIVGAVTQRLTFESSTRCRSLRIPPQQHPPSSKVGQTHIGAVLVGKTEIRSSGTGGKHALTL
jgi:hypothetical protein